jgi:hypothetical protein
MSLLLYVLFAEVAQFASNYFVKQSDNKRDNSRITDSSSVSMRAFKSS